MPARDEAEVRALVESHLPFGHFIKEVMEHFNFLKQIDLNFLFVANNSTLNDI